MYHWPAAEEVVGAESDNEQADQPLGSIQASIDAVHARYISCKPDGKLTKEVIRQIFERLDAEFTAKAEARKIRVSKATPSNDVSEVYSPPRVTDVAEATGLRPGWALDLTVDKDDGTP